MPIYICKNDTSTGGSGTAANKFWSYEKQGNNVLVKWGRVGLEGQNKLHEFYSSSEQAKFIAKKTKQKEGKGYALSDDKQKQKEDKIAKLMGHQNKIQRMQWVRKLKTQNKLTFISNYDPKQYVYVEILDSWKKTVTRLLLSKEESSQIEGVAEYEDRIIEYEDSFRPDAGFVSGVREALKELARKVAAITVKFAAIGVRKLSLDDDMEDDDPVILDIYEEVGESGASKQVVSKFAALGARTLDL